MTVIIGVVLIIIFMIVMYDKGESKKERKEKWLSEYAFISELIGTSEVSKTAYRNLLIAFRSLNSIKYHDSEAYSVLINNFYRKYETFIADDLLGKMLKRELTNTLNQ